MTDDHALLEAWRQGDSEAGSDLFTRHFEGVHRFFVNKVGTDAEACIQRTFVRAREARHGTNGHPAVRTYFLSLAYAVYCERRNTPSQGEPAGSALPFRVMSTNGVILRALRRVSVEAQVLLELRYFERLGPAEIGHIIGLSKNETRERMRRAQIALDAVLALDNEDDTEPPA